MAGDWELTVRLAAYEREGGPVTGFYHKTESPPPPGVRVVPISDAEWVRAIGVSGKYTVAAGHLVPPGEDAVFADRQATARAAAAARCDRAIRGGFGCDALGTPHLYPAALTDQINLQAAVTDGGAGPLWCADAAGLWSYREHTADQLRRVAHALRCVVVAAQRSYAARVEIINRATSYTELDAP